VVGLKIDGSTEKYCLIGDPVKHSLSPLIMNTLFQKYRINSVYFACRVLESDLDTAIAGLKSLGIKGFNLTMPHKISVLKYLDELAEDARKIGAVNTVLNNGGRLVGYNTDWKGVLDSLEAHGLRKLGKCVLLGAGGAARATLYATMKLCDEIVVINRTYAKAVELINTYVGDFENIVAREFRESIVREEVSNADLIVNATPIGMEGNESPVPKDVIKSHMIIFDLVYSPINTLLLKYAREKEAIAIDGLWMLIYQAIEAFKIWIGISPDPGFLRMVIEEEIGWKDTA